MVEFQDHPEEQLEHYIAYILTKIIRIIQISIPLVAKFSRDHPNVFLVLSSVMIIYMSWRLICNIALIIKRLILAGLLVFAIFLYLRGFKQVVYKDLPLLFKLIKQNGDFEAVYAKWATYLNIPTVNQSSIAYSFISSRLNNLFTEIDQILRNH